MAIHQSALTSISDFFPSSEVVTTQQTDGAAYKLKPRSFHKSTHLQVHSVDFHSSVNHAWQHQEQHSHIYHLYSCPQQTHHQNCYDRCLLGTAWTRVKGMMIWSAMPHVVSVSASCRRYCYLASSLQSLYVFVLMYASLWTYELV